MRDPLLSEIVTALDHAPVRPAPVPAPALAAAQARLAAARAVLGASVSESAYLAFARHLAPQPTGRAPIAASA